MSLAQNKTEEKRLREMFHILVIDNALEKIRCIPDIMY